MSTEPKILTFDIETSPIIAYTWQTRNVDIHNDQIIEDWTVLAWAAKWLGSDKIMYRDTSRQKNLRDDKAILEVIYGLINQADVLVSQNGINFDMKKLNSRFVQHGMKPVNRPKHIDTCRIAQTVFGFTSNKLEFLSAKLCKKYKKLSHEKYPGLELWKQYLDGNRDAQREMRKYNEHDVLSTEELYTIISPWSKTSHLGQLLCGAECVCGKGRLIKNGFTLTTRGKFQRFKCSGCGAFSRGSDNFLIKEQRKAILVGA